MDLGFLATANSITGMYFDHTAAGRSSVSETGSEGASNFGRSLEKVYRGVNGENPSDDNVRQYTGNPLSKHAARLGFSIDNRVFDMLNVQLTDSMSSMINTAMNNAMDDLAEAM